MKEAHEASRLGIQLERHRLAVQVTFDCLAWAIALPLGLIFRYEFETSPNGWGPFTLSGLIVAVIAACALQIVSGLALGLYRGHWRYGSFDEVAHLGRSTALVTVSLAVINTVAAKRILPLSVVFVGGVAALVLMAAVRYVWVGSSRVDLQACKLEYSIVSPK